MESLLDHLLDEIAMDGDAGCTLSRFDSFIDTFHRRENSEQNVDDDFRKFVWSQVRELPNIQLGRLVKLEGDDIPVPEPKAASRSKKDRDARVSDVHYAFQKIDDEEVVMPRDELEEKYGDALRIAADSELCWLTITGSHSKPTSLTPLVYAVLQSVAQGREDGKTVVELGKEFDHDQKSLFHFVNTAKKLNIVVKFRDAVKRGPVTNRVVHKRYINTSEHYQAFIRSEPVGSVSKVKKDDNADESGAESDEELDGTTVPIMSHISTDALYNNHNLIASRIIKLLQHAPKNVYKTMHLPGAIGLDVRPRKQERRRLNRIVNKMVDEGQIKRANLPGKHNLSLHPAIELGDLQAQASETADTEMQETTGGYSTQQDLSRPTRTPMLLNLPIDVQILEILASEGSDGATLSELLEMLADVELRALDQILARVELKVQPPEVADMAIIGIRESHGREKRVRWFNRIGYADRCAADRIPAQHELLPNPDRVGEFANINPQEHYQNLKELTKFTNIINGGHKVSQILTGKKKAAARAPPKPKTTPSETKKSKAKAEASGDGPPKPKKPRKSKKKDVEEQIAEASTSQLPPTEGETSTQASILPQMMTQEDFNAIIQASNLPPARPRGRKKQKKLNENGEEVDQLEQPSPQLTPDTSAVDISVALQLDDKRGKGTQGTIKGRPRKYPPGTSKSDRRRFLEAKRALQGLPIRPPPKSKAKKAESSKNKKKKKQQVVESEQSDQDQLISDVDDEHQPVASTSGTQLDEKFPSISTSGTHVEPTDIPVDTVSQTAVAAGSSSAITAPKPTADIAPAPKKRGRPRKHPISDGNAQPPAKRVRREPAVARPRRKAAQDALDVMAAVAGDQIAFENAISIEPKEEESTAIPALQEPSALQQIEATADDPAQEDPIDDVNVPMQDAQPATAIAIQSPVPAVSNDDTALSNPATTTSNLPGNRDETPHSPSLPVPSAPATPLQPSKLDTSAPSTVASALTATQHAAASRPFLKNMNSRVSHTLLKHGIALLDCIKGLGGVFEEYELFGKYKQYIKDNADGAKTFEFDRKSYSKTLNDLENRGEIKRTKALLSGAGASNTVKTIIYLPTLATDGPEFKACLSDFQKKAAHHKFRRQTAVHSAEILADGEDAVVTESQFNVYHCDLIQSTDWRTIAQWYGYVHGRCARARALHYSLIKLFEEAASKHIISTQQSGRLIAVAGIYNDIDLATYMLAVPQTHLVRELDEYLARTDIDFTTHKVSDVPKVINDVLSPGLHRSTGKMDVLLALLQELRILHPLQEMGDNQADIVAAVSLSDPSNPEKRLRYASASIIPAATHFLLSDSVPMWNFGAKADDEGQVLLEEKPFLYQSEVSTQAQAENYWDTLERLSNEPNEVPAAPPSAEHPPFVNKAFSNFITAGRNWKDRFYANNTQMQFINSERAAYNSAESPEDRQKELERISKGGLIPIEAAKALLERTMQAKKYRRKPKPRRSRAKKKVDKEDDDEAGDEDDPLALSRKIAEKAAGHAFQRQRDFEAITARFIPVFEQGAYHAAIQRLRHQFLDTNEINAIDLQESIKEIRADPQAFMSRSVRFAPKTTYSNTSGLSKYLHSRSVGLPLSANANIQTTRKKPRKGKVDASKGPVKRIRHAFNDGDRENLLDGWVILRCCANKLDQKFVNMQLLSTFVGRHTPSALRNRLNKLIGDGYAPYMDALQDEWHAIWMRDVEAGFLPEFTSSDYIDFDLAAHVNCLRSKINKTQIRIQTATRSQNDNNDFKLPLYIPAGAHDTSAASPWSQAFIDIPTVTKWSGLIDKSFSAPSVRVGTAATCTTLSREEDLSASVVKMILSTPSDLYAENIATNLGKPVEGQLPRAMEYLTSTGAVVTHSRAVKTPGRAFQYSASYLKALETSATLADHEHAIQTVNEIKEEVIDWPLISADGAMMSLCRLVSADAVSCDIVGFHNEEPKEEGNRRPDDAHIEPLLSFSIDTTLFVPKLPLEEHSSAVSVGDSHCKTVMGETTPCYREQNINALTACQGCISEATAMLSDPVKAVYTNVLVAGVDGTLPRNLLDASSKIIDEVKQAVDVLTSTSPPLVFWTGYDTHRLVAASFYHSWTVPLVTSGDKPAIRVEPCGWMDIHGSDIVQQKALSMNLITNILMQYPGLCESEIVKKASSHFNRLETTSILHFLLGENLIQRRAMAGERDHGFGWSNSHYYICSPTPWFAESSAQIDEEGLAARGDCINEE